MARRPSGRTRSMRIVGVAIVVGTMLVAGCGSDGDRGDLAGVPGPDEQLEPSEWVARSVKGEDVLTRFPSVTLRFDREGRVDGSSGCNQYGGTYEIEASAIIFVVGPTTRMACEEAQGRQELRFFEALEDAAAFEIEGDELTLRDADGIEVASFEAA
ncbi:MAG: META domain-containing protein [Acidimicrobiia bacterium]|nr:META domain-containing protein [Acidimicrobiia bacterium]